VNGENLIVPDWPAPRGVRAAVTTRMGGVSARPFDSLNLGAHVGDDATHVEENRRRVARALNLAVEPAWLTQVHGTVVANLDDGPADMPADAAFSTRADRVCALLTADCLPVLICDRSGARVGAAHAGWRGLAAGVVEALVGNFACAGDALMAWLGPAIGPTAFEVGPEVRDCFLAHDPAAGSAFTRGASERWHADIYRLARQRLGAAGVRAVYGGEHCTHADPARFFSYRRDGRCGRMATLIWRDARPQAPARGAGAA